MDHPDLPGKHPCRCSGEEGSGLLKKIPALRGAVQPGERHQVQQVRRWMKEARQPHGISRAIFLRRVLNPSKSNLKLRGFLLPN